MYPTWWSDSHEEIVSSCSGFFPGCAYTRHTDQEGAHALAERGWNKTQILTHYYPGTSTQSWRRVELP